MIGLSKVCFLVIVAAMVSVPADAQRPARLPYVTKTAEIKGNVLLVIVKRTTNHAVWGNLYHAVHRTPFWSEDGKAMAVFVYRDERNEGPQDTILTWREGNVYTHIPVPNYYKDHDGVLDIVWSPDKKRLMIRDYASAGLEYDGGWLFCYEFRTAKWHTGPKWVRHPEWIDNRTVRFKKTVSDAPRIRDRRLGFSGNWIPAVEKRWRIWKVPKSP